MTEIKEVVPEQGYVIFLTTLLAWLAQLRLSTKPWLRSELHVQRCELCLLRAAWEMIRGQGEERE